MWDLVGKPKDRFSHNKAHIKQTYFKSRYKVSPTIQSSIDFCIFCIFTNKDQYCIESPSKDAANSADPDHTAPLGLTDNW